MSLFYKKPNEEKQKPTDLEMILDLKEQNTRMKLLINETHGRLWSGTFIGGLVLTTGGLMGVEMDLNKYIGMLQEMAREYVKLTEKHDEPIPERLTEYCNKYREKKPDNPPKRRRWWVTK